MRMLETDSADADIAVTLNDQENINKFSRFNNRADELVDVLEGLKKSIEDLEELEMELELVDDEDELIMYKLDSSFVHLPAPEILVLLKTSLTKLTGELAGLEEEKVECEEGMKELKTILYAKFGTSINLERGD